MKSFPLLLVLLSSLAACDEGGEGSSVDAAPPPDAPPPDAGPADATTFSSLELIVPAGYTGTPRQLIVYLATSLPLAGPPAAILLQQNDPVITAGATLSLTLDTVDQQGQYFVGVALYMQGGGQFVPVAGVDYVAGSGAAFALTGAPVDLGQLTLALAE